MAYKAIISGHIWTDEKGNKEIDILTHVDNNELEVDVFCDIEHVLINEIETGDSEDYYFIVLVKTEFARFEHYNDREYDGKIEIIEIKNIDDLKKL